MTGLPARLQACFQRRDFAALRELYAEDAVLEVHVGGVHDVHAGRAAVVDRYAEDFASPAVFLRWAVREAAWGAVVEAAAVQGDGITFRWVHVLGIEEGRIATDTVYCTGAIATPSTSAAPDAVQVDAELSLRGGLTPWRWVPSEAP